MRADDGKGIGALDRVCGDGLLQAGGCVFALIAVLYTFGCAQPSLPVVDTPTFDPNGGTFVGSVNVTIACTTADATIRYTTDGSDPNASSTEYTGPIQLTATTTLKARAFMGGMTDSDVGSATFTVQVPAPTSAGQVSTPTFDPNAGTFVDSVNVTIACATTDATFRYTTDGSDPDASSPAYAGPIHLTLTTTIKARAFKSGMTDSAVASATYIVTSTRRVSVDSGGTQSDGNSAAPSISSDGRYVAFGSMATNLVTGDLGHEDIFVHDRQTGHTTRVSLSSDGLQANGTNRRPSISADGRYVAFDSEASNVVTGDTNGKYDVFVHDRQTGQTTLVSADYGGGPSNDHSSSPSISADGRYVAFNSIATDLVTGDTNGKSDVFVHDRDTGQTTRVSVDSDGSQATGDDSTSASISSDGRYVAFKSGATNLVDDDSNGDWDVFVHDRDTGQTTRVSVKSDGTQASGGPSRNPSISPDGRYVAFDSIATNLVNGDSNGKMDVFVHDRQTGQTTRVSVDSAGMQATDDSQTPSISSDGRCVAFSSRATDLVPDDTNGMMDIFVYDRGQ